MAIKLSSLGSVSPTYFPLSAEGTYTVNSISAGVYLLTTESSQTFSLSFQSTAGYKFTTTMR